MVATLLLIFIYDNLLLILLFSLFYFLLDVLSEITSYLLELIRISGGCQRL